MLASADAQESQAQWDAIRIFAGDRGRFFVTIDETSSSRPTAVPSPRGQALRDKQLLCWHKASLSVDRHVYSSYYLRLDSDVRNGLADQDNYTDSLRASGDQRRN